MERAPNTTSITEEEKTEEIEFLALLVFIATLLFSQLLLYVSRKLQQSVVPEAGLLLMLGMVIGGLIRTIDHVGMISAVEKLTEFDENLFFIVLLPPIIFESGFTIRRDMFIGNFFLILALAIFGTLISSFVVGGIMFSLSSYSSNAIYTASWIECLVFGAIISATDPVTVIAVFQSIGVKPGLHILVFGESVLNDAVAIVLYRTLVLFENNVLDSTSPQPVMDAVTDFIINLFGSALMGIAMGIGSAILFKWLRLWDVNLRELECTVAITLPYLSYTLAQGVNISGIVSMLFTAIIMGSFTRHNLSVDASKFISEVFHILAHMAETFVFIYLGMAIFTGDANWSRGSVAFGFAGMFACMVARFASVVPLCILGNIGRKRALRISCSEIFMLWWSGLRGGMAFALAASSSNMLTKESTGQVFEAATTIIIFITVFFFGGSTRCLSTRFGLVDRAARSPIPSPYDEEHKLISEAHRDVARIDPSMVIVEGTDEHGLTEVELTDLSRSNSRASFDSLEDDYLGNENPFGHAASQLQSTTPATRPPATSFELEDGDDMEEKGTAETVGVATRWERFENRFLRPMLIRDPDSAPSPHSGVSHSRASVIDPSNHSPHTPNSRHSESYLSHT